MSYDSINVESGFYTEEEQDKYKAENEESHFKSNFGFLNSHNGLRRKKMHLFIAPTGVGKSTFIRSLVRDVIFHNPGKKVFVWLSEETTKEFKVQMSYGMPAHDILKNVFYLL